MIPFSKNQKAIFLKDNKNHLECNVVDPGSTQTSIFFFDDDNGRKIATFKIVDNSSIIDIDEYKILNRDNKINEITNED